MANKTPDILFTDVPSNSSTRSNRLANAGSCSIVSGSSGRCGEETSLPNSTYSTSLGQSHFDLYSSDISTGLFVQKNNFPHGTSNQKLLGSASARTEHPPSCESRSCWSVCNDASRSLLSSVDLRSTITSNNSSIPCALLESNESEIRWQRINRYLKCDLEGIPNESLWKRIAITLFGNIETWAQNTLENYTPPNWDFCVIHTKDEIDLEIVKAFLKILDMEGLKGISLSEFRVDDFNFEASAKILSGSKVIFALDSLPFSKSDFHRLQFQESTNKAIAFQDWKKKIIPLRPPKTDLLRYKQKFPLLWYKTKGSSLVGLTSTEAILLGKEGYIIEKVRQVLTIHQQEINKEHRRQNLTLFKHSIELAKESKCRNLREGLEELMRFFERENYSSDSLVRFCHGCEELPSFSSDGDESQIITLDNSTEITIGPSFHINVSRSNEQHN